MTGEVEEIVVDGYGTMNADIEVEQNGPAVDFSSVCPLMSDARKVQQMN